MSTNKQTTETTAKGWAAEKARAIAGSERAAGRYAKLAQVLLDAERKGETHIAFGEVNRRTGLRRGERGDPGANWRRGLQRLRQLVDGFDHWRVDADRGALVRADQ